MAQTELEFEVLGEELGVCKVSASHGIPQWAYQGEFFSVTRTPEELSIVCMENAIPNEVICERGWRALKIRGILDFSLIGILSIVSSVMAKAGVSIFAISTYNTDYILVKAGDLTPALQALRKEGYSVVQP